MTLKKFSRAGLLALAFGVLLGLCLSMTAFDTSSAQPAPPPRLRPRHLPPRRRLRPRRRRLASATPIRRRP